MKEWPKILSIAGFDPSGGAGVLADVKTFEAHRCMGFAVITANTIQNESEFLSPNWIDEALIFKQLDHLLKIHAFQYVKIGLIPSLSFLKKVNAKLLTHNPSVKIIWDPILSASSGFDFKHDLVDLEEVLKKIFLITPNWDEAKLLSNNKEALRGAETLSKYTNVYLKGGHNEEKPGKDYFFFDGEACSFNPKNRIPVYDKHGSGCVLSSALTANFAKGFPSSKVCLKSKRYLESFLTSSTALLGKHKI